MTMPQGESTRPVDLLTRARIEKSRRALVPDRISGRSAANLGFFLLQFFGATFADTIYVVWMPSVLKQCTA